MYSYYPLTDLKIDKAIEDMRQWLKTVMLRIQQLQAWIIRVVFGYPNVKCCNGYKHHPEQFCNQLELCQPDVKGIVSARIYPSRSCRTYPQYVMYALRTTDSLKIFRELSIIWNRVIDCNEWSSWHYGKIQIAKLTSAALADHLAYRQMICKFWLVHINLGEAMSILKFIKLIRGRDLQYIRTGCTAKYYSSDHNKIGISKISKYIFGHGDCWRFALIIKAVYPSAQAHQCWNKTHKYGHVVVEYDRKFYDITGRLRRKDWEIDRRNLSVANLNNYIGMSLDQVNTCVKSVLE